MSGRFIASIDQFTGNGFRISK